MANESLKGLNVAILVTDGFEQVELTEPRTALDEAGAKTQIVSPKNKHVRAWKFTDWGIELPVDVKLEDAQPEDFDALLLPGGVINPDTLRIEPKAGSLRQGLLRRRQAGRCNLPRTLDRHRGRRGARSAHHLMAFAEDRSQERRCRLG